METIRQLTSPDGRPPSPPPGVIRTTASGRILWVNDVAAGLLNISERAAPGRSLLVFFNGDRGRLLDEMARAMSGQVCEIETPLRPRERRPFMARVDLSTAPDVQSVELEWVLEPI